MSVHFVYVDFIFVISLRNGLLSTSIIVTGDIYWKWPALLAFVSKKYAIKRKPTTYGLTLNICMYMYIYILKQAHVSKPTKCYDMLAAQTY